MMAMGLGLSSLRMVKTNSRGQMDPEDLEVKIASDKRDGALPVCVVPSIGTVTTGVIDPVQDIVDVARGANLWVHADGSYGAAAAMLNDPPAELLALKNVDSIAWDPHKWMRVPYESACLLVRDAQALTRSFGFRPSYYNSGDLSDTVHHYERGPQNSRQLRALKVWMSITQHGKEGHAALIQRDITLAQQLHRLVEKCPVLEAWSCNLSIVVFRYRPALPEVTDIPLTEADLNMINQNILDRLQQSGDAYLTNAVIGERFLLRACFVNHNTRDGDLEYVVRLITEIGADVVRRLSVSRMELVTRSVAGAST
jgi:glutamate/tyrosine decarboxylase-like PLP-dependent enzyme